MILYDVVLKLFIRNFNYNIFKKDQKYMIQQVSIEQINQNEQQKKFFNGKWSKSEHVRFLKGFSAFGKNWSEIQKLVKTRNLAQVRSHAQKHFLKTKEEEEDSS